MRMGGKRQAVKAGVGVFFITALVAFPVFADLESEIAKLKPLSFCINASLENAWQATLEVLKESGMEATLEDKKYYVITTAFAAADFAQLRKLAANARPFKKGRFTLKIGLEEVTPAFTKIHLTLQVRQNPMFGKRERLLKTNGSFEKFLAFRINRLAMDKQFPGLYEIRLGMDLLADLRSEQYLIANVEADSPAGEAGFQNGDWLAAIDGREISIRGELFDVLLSKETEKLHRFRILRRGAWLEIPVWVIRVKETGEKLGIHLAWDSKARRFFASEVDAQSRAERAGLAPGDAILEEDGFELTGWTNYYRALGRAKKGASVKLKIARDARILIINV